MPVEKFLTLFPEYRYTWDQLVYAKYCERNGMRFLVDFGFENAESLAWEHIENGDFLLGHA